jgi:hypothetical protein
MCFSKKEGRSTWEIEKSGVVSRQWSGTKMERNPARYIAAWGAQNSGFSNG